MPESGGELPVAVLAEEILSLPHGFGHNRPGTRLGLAEQHAGVSYNNLTDAAAVDAVSGNAALNGNEVEIRSC